MKRALFVLVLLAVCFVVVGFSMGWLHISSNSGDGKSKVTVTVDKDKMQQDKDKAVERVRGKGDNQPR